ncbi:MAG: phage holin family protein [Candidatus Paceibacterota bacterium]
MNSLIAKLIAGVAGAGLSIYILKGGITYDGNIATIILAGITIGLLFYFIKPLLNVITFPLRLITLNLFSFVIIMFLVWIVDILFSTHLEINGLQNLFWMSLIVLAIDILFSAIFKPD